MIQSVSDKHSGVPEAIAVKDVQSGGEKIPLQPSDIIISTMDRTLGVSSASSSSREFCQIVRLYANGTVLARVLGTDAPRLLKVSSIMVNLSFVGLKEQAYTSLRRTREDWRPGMRVEVFSRSLDCWCVGYICRCIELRSDARIAHGDLWFELAYFAQQISKVCYKQVKFDKKDFLRDNERLKEPELWEQFHHELLKQNENYLPKQLHERLGSPVKRRSPSPSPQSSESTTSMGEDLTSENDLKKAQNSSSFPPPISVAVPMGIGGTPLFHRAPSIDELPDDIDKCPTDAVQKEMTGYLDLPKCGITEIPINMPMIRRQPSIDEEPKEPNEIQIAV